MPRFYFHLYNDMNAVDDEGKELPNLAAARAFAQEQARQLIGEMIKESGRIVLSHRIDIEDAQQRPLDSVHFRDVVTVEP